MQSGFSGSRYTFTVEYIITSTAKFLWAAQKDNYGTLWNWMQAHRTATQNISHWWTLLVRGMYRGQTLPVTGWLPFSTLEYLKLYNHGKKEFKVKGWLPFSILEYLKLHNHDKKQFKTTKPNNQVYDQWPMRNKISNTDQ